MVKRVEKGASFVSAQHVVGAQQARKAQHGFTDNSQELGRFHESYALAGLDLFCEPPDEHTQQGDLIPKDDPFRDF